ncbi:hypothetical protein EAH_00061670, partial [Eimeria acervulina]
FQRAIGSVGAAVIAGVVFIQVVTAFV